MLFPKRSSTIQFCQNHAPQKCHELDINGNLQKCVDGGSFGKPGRRSFHIFRTWTAFVLCASSRGCSASSPQQTCASRIHTWTVARCCGLQHEPAVLWGQRRTHCSGHSGRDYRPGKDTRATSALNAAWNAGDTVRTSTSRSLYYHRTARCSAFGRQSGKLWVIPRGVASCWSMSTAVGYSRHSEYLMWMIGSLPVEIAERGLVRWFWRRKLAKVSPASISLSEAQSFFAGFFEHLKNNNSNDGVIGKMF